MSGILEQAKAAASSAATTVSNAAVQAATTTQNLASQAYNSETTAQITEQAKALAGQAATATGGVLGQAGVAVHQGAHTLAPNIVPAPGVPVGGVDKSHDLEPESAADKAKLEKLFQSRPDASDLQEKGILKGEPGDSLAGKKAELEKSMLGDKLDKELASRPAPEELVKKGILNADETPGSQ